MESIPVPLLAEALLAAVELGLAAPVVVAVVVEIEDVEDDEELLKPEA